MQHIIESLIVGALFIGSVVFIIRKYFGKKASPCGGCTACNRGQMEQQKQKKR